MSLFVPRKRGIGKTDGFDLNKKIKCKIKYNNRIYRYSFSILSRRGRGRAEYSINILSVPKYTLKQITSSDHLRYDLRVYHYSKRSAYVSWSDTIYSVEDAIKIACFWARAATIYLSDGYFPVNIEIRELEEKTEVIE